MEELEEEMLNQLRLSIKKVYRNCSFAKLPNDNYAIIFQGEFEPTARNFDLIDRAVGRKGVGKKMYEHRYVEYTAGKNYYFITGYFNG